MFFQSGLRTLMLLTMFAGLTIYAIFGGYFARELVVEIAILAIMAISLDLVAGFGGMVSLCHGAIMGLSAYCYAILTLKLGIPPLPSSLFAIATAGVFGTLLGWITGRTSGIFFIMVTLAFGQMCYTLIQTSSWLGGDDGISGLSRFDLSWIGIKMSKSLNFAIFSLTLAAITYAIAAWIMQSAFGRTLVGIHSNEQRMRAIGVNTVAHKAQAMGLSSLLAGVAGILAAQHIQFISPDLLFWTTSGEVLIVLILGGLGTLVGPFAGALIFVVLKHQVSTFTSHWHLIVGLLLITTVLVGGRGVYGQLEYVIHKLRAKNNA